MAVMVAVEVEEVVVSSLRLQHKVHHCVVVSNFDVLDSFSAAPRMSFSRLTWQNCISNPNFEMEKNLSSDQQQRIQIKTSAESNDFLAAS